MGESIIRILIADSPPPGSLRLRALIGGRRELRVVAEASRAEAIVPAARRDRAEVALVDLRLGLEGGLIWSLTRDLGPTTRVLLQARRGQEDQVHDALASGVRGFVLQDASAEELLFAIHAVAAGGLFVSPSVLARVVHSAPGRESEERSPAQSNLTAREIEVIRLIARGLSNREIARTLRVAETTVRTHVGHLLNKLDLRNRVEIAAFAYQAQIAPRMRTAGMGLAV